MSFFLLKAIVLGVADTATPRQQMILQSWPKQEKQCDRGGVPQTMGHLRSCHAVCLYVIETGELFLLSRKTGIKLWVELIMLTSTHE